MDRGCGEAQPQHFRTDRPSGFVPWIPALPLTANSRKGASRSADSHVRVKLTLGDLGADKAVRAPFLNQPCPSLPLRLVFATAAVRTLV